MNAWTTLIEAGELATVLDRCIVIDCRHDLARPDAGPEAYAQGHIPGASFLHQDEDLAGPRNGRNGRHPLPDREALAARLRACGLHRGQQLVACDAHGGMYAARLWWLARWLGHEAVAVLDGGLPAWQREGLPLSTARPSPAPGDFRAGAPLTRQIEADALLAALGDPQLRVIDARAPERYRGEVEPMDPVAGHIPGALNRPFALNLRPDGRFKPAPVLRAELQALAAQAGVSPGQLVHQCGSGVTACHNLLAAALAGLPEGRLYPGSWSEWCADPARPVASGSEPG
jgi:thiosulfate/3-mercaptopyruvate sulfurtransferase